MRPGDPFPDPAAPAGGAVRRSGFPSRFCEFGPQKPVLQRDRRCAYTPPPSARPVPAAIVPSLIRWQFRRITGPIVHRLCWLPLFAVCLTGCEWLSSLGPSKVDDPVLDPPPPRRPISEGSLRPDPKSPDSSGYPYSSAGNTQGEYQLVSGSVDAGPRQQYSGPQKVATVDGKAILASQVLDRYSQKLKQAESQASADDLMKLRKALIQRDLPMHVQRQLLVNALKRSVPAKNRDKLKELVNAAFEKEVDRLKQELKVDTKFDVKKKLEQEGSSLENLRDSFANQQMAAYFFQQNVSKGKQTISRREMLDYYEKHLKDYAIPARVRWQEIQVSFGKHHGRDGALDVVHNAVRALKNGDDFADVAKKYSDGISAAKGGMWDWTQSGSLTDQKLEEALFNLPVGRISRPLEGRRSYRLVRVVDRENAGWKSFGDMQGDIKAKLEQERKRAAARRVINRLVRDATITTIFDGDPKFKPQWGIP